MKRLLALLLCLCLCASLIPAAAAADAEDIEIVDAEEETEEDLIPVLELEPLDADRDAPDGTPASEINAAAAAQSVPLDSAHFPDAIFRSYLSEEYDKDQDGVLSGQELSCVIDIDTTCRGVSSLEGVGLLPFVRHIDCGGGVLTSLDTSGCAELFSLACSDNRLSSLNLAGCAELYRLECQNNRLTSLIFSDSPDLHYLYCSDNELSSLDATACPSLLVLECRSNRLTSLKVSCANLDMMDCSGNLLCAVDLSDCDTLKAIVRNGDQSVADGVRQYDYNHGRLVVDRTTALILSNPRSLTVSAGDTAGFSVEAVGEGLSYQWQYYSSGDKAWYNITSSAYSGVKTAAMSVPATAARSGFIFRCAVTNAVGTCWTKAAKLTVVNTPAILSQPSSVTKYPGETASFKVTASGAEGYQWQFCSAGDNAWYNITNSAYSGTKTASMSVQATLARSGFIFRCAVTNAYGTAYTDPVTLTVESAKPTITKQPESQEKKPGETASFTVTAIDAASYQWQYYSSGDNTWYNITNSAYVGAKTATMSVQATTWRRGFIFRCAVTNGNGTVYTNSVMLFVKAEAPTIMIQPSTVSATAGGTAAFTVYAAGENLSYQWQYYSEAYRAWYPVTNANYSGTKTKTMSVQATTARHGFIFRCAVMNAAGTVYTNSVCLYVLPEITAPPQSVTAAAGETASFAVAASGAASYQWQFYSSYYHAWYNITNSAYSGAKTAAMSVPATAARSGFIFRCAITNAAGTVYTDSVTLTVTG